MAQDPARYRPKMYPPPQFPPRRVPLFANTPPALFPPILGLLGLVAALRIGAGRIGVGAEIVDLATGMTVLLWLAAVCIYAAKLVRRVGVIQEDLAIMPSRAGLSAATLGGMVAAGQLAGVAPSLGIWLLWLVLALHAVLVVLTLRVLIGPPAEGRAVNPGWHMTFVGFIVAGPAAVALQEPEVARLLVYATLPLAVAIWGASLVQLARRIPPAPLRPMLAIHLAPASLLSITASLTGLEALGLILAWLALVIVLVLAAGLPWIVESGFSPLWGAFTFPLTAAASALILQGGALAWAGFALLALAVVVVPWIGLKIFRMWPGGRLAARTNAAEA